MQTSKIPTNSYLLIFSFLIILTKWSFSYFFFSENTDIKIIFESITDGKYYYPLIKYLSDFNFSHSFDPNINNLEVVPLPFGGIIWHSLFFKIIGFKSFILLEFLCLFLFLFIFSNLFNYIFNNQFLSIVMSVLLFLSPMILKSLGLYDFQPIKVFTDNIYNFRVPRPMISNIYFFSFFLILLKMCNKNFFSYKYLILIGAISALSISSFYYHFIIELLTFIIVFCLRFKSKILFELKNNIKSISISLIVFFVILSPFLTNLYFHETDFTNRQCIFQISFFEKKILIEYILKKIFYSKFIVVIFFVGIIQILINKYYKKFQNLLNISFILFISSILAPIIFILFTSKSCVIYHFINLIILTLSIHFLLFTFVLLKNIAKKFSHLFFFPIIFCLFFYFLFLDFQKNKNFSLNVNSSIERKEFQLVSEIIKNNFNIKQIDLLTFDTNFMIWAILNDIEYIKLLNGLFTSKKDYMLENDLISSFKILNQDKKNFYEFIKNKKETWRYMNHDFAKIFFYKYQANSLRTFNDSKNFLPEEKDYIKKSSPLLHQQSILPLEELDRFLKKYKNFDLPLRKPDVIILDKNDLFLDLEKIDYENYCTKFSGDKFILFFNISKINC